MSWLKTWRTRRACFHHDTRSGTSWIASRLVDFGRAKHHWCTRCGRYWTR
jgi:hypothetical protein